MYNIILIKQLYSKNFYTKNSVISMKPISPKFALKAEASSKIFLRVMCARTEGEEGRHSKVTWVQISGFELSNTKSLFHSERCVFWKKKEDKEKDFSKIPLEFPMPATKS